METGQARAHALMWVQAIEAKEEEERVLGEV